MGICRNEWCNICGIAGSYINIRCKTCVVWDNGGVRRKKTSYTTWYIFAGRHTFIQINLGLNQAISKAQETKLFLLVGAYDLLRKLSLCVHAHEPTLYYVDDALCMLIPILSSGCFWRCKGLCGHLHTTINSSLSNHSLPTVTNCMKMVWFVWTHNMHLYTPSNVVTTIPCLTTD